MIHELSVFSPAVRQRLITIALFSTTLTLGVPPQMLFTSWAQVNTRLVAEHSAAASSDITVSIPIAAQIKILRRPTAIDITSQDVRRGYVNISEAYVFTLWSNSKDGCRVLIEWDGLLSEASGMYAQATAYLFRQGGETIFKSPRETHNTIYRACGKMNHEEISVDLKILLGPRTRPGHYKLDPELVVDPNPPCVLQLSGLSKIYDNKCGMDD